MKLIFALKKNIILWDVLGGKKRKTRPETSLYKSFCLTSPVPDKTDVLHGNIYWAYYFKGKSFNTLYIELPSPAPPNSLKSSKNTLKCFIISNKITSEDEMTVEHLIWLLLSTRF